MSPLEVCGYLPLSSRQVSLWSGASSCGGCLWGVLREKLHWRQLANGVSWMGQMCMGVEHQFQQDRWRVLIPTSVWLSSLGVGGNGTYQLFCSWRSLLKVPALSAHIRLITLHLYSRHFANSCFCAVSQSGDGPLRAGTQLPMVLSFPRAKYANFKQSVLSPDGYKTNS